MATLLQQSHAPMWRRSSYSSVQGNCVEVAGCQRCDVVVRDSKQRAFAVLRFARRDWTDLLVALVGQGN
jgi:endonuclease YncB( thermonuclease family)